MECQIKFNMDNDDFVLYPNCSIDSVAKQIRDYILANIEQQPVDSVGLEGDGMVTEYKPFVANLHDMNGNIIGEVEVK